MSPKLESRAVNYWEIPNNTAKWWFLDPALRFNMMHSVGICSALFFNRYDGSLFNGLQSITAWQEYFNHPSPEILGLMNSSGFLPGIVASFFADRLNDYVGRKRTLWVGSVINMIGIVLMSLSTGVGTFCGGRVLIGFGISTALTVGPPLLQETAHPRYRAQIGSFFTSIYYIAAIMSAAICLRCLNVFGEIAWRAPCWVQMFGPVATIALTSNMPESPRWLVSKGRIEEARAVLVKWHANGKDDDELVQYEFSQIVDAINEEKNPPQTRHTDSLRSPGNRHRLMILFVVGISINWVGNGIVAYYLNPILGSIGITSSVLQLQILLYLQIWNSWLFVLGLSGRYAQTTNKAFGIAVVPFFFLFFTAYDIAYTPMSYSYPIEILTYSLRTKGSALYITIETAAVAVNTWVNPVALNSIGWKYYGVYVVINFVLVFIIYFGFPETKGLMIEEIAVLFDGEGSVSRTAYAGHDTSNPDLLKVRDEIVHTSVLVERGTK